MLDTLMVLWTRGIYGRFLQTLAAFLLLFLGICALLFLVTTSGVRWPGLAVTAAPPVTSGAASAVTPASNLVPVILQNPTPGTTHMHQAGAKHTDRHRHPGIPTLIASPTPGDQSLFP
jgi:hypothetical protein